MFLCDFAGWRYVSVLLSCEYSLGSLVTRFLVPCCGERSLSHSDKCPRICTAFTLSAVRQKEHILEITGLITNKLLIAVDPRDQCEELTAMWMTCRHELTVQSRVQLSEEEETGYHSTESEEERGHELASGVSSHLPPPPPSPPPITDAQTFSPSTSASSLFMDGLRLIFSFVRHRQDGMQASQSCKTWSAAARTCAPRGDSVSYMHCFSFACFSIFSYSPSTFDPHVTGLHVNSYELIASHDRVLSRIHRLDFQVNSPSA
jgi:hypothetical protein